MSFDNIKKLFIGDRWIWVVITFLTILSFLSVYSAASVLAYVKNNGDMSSYILKHGIMLLMGIGVAVFVSRIHPKYFSGLAEVMVGVGFAGLIFALLAGNAINGSSRWISIGGFTVQPSEFAKYALIIFVAKRLAIANEPKKAFLPILIASGLICVPIMLENLSTCILVGLSVFIMMMIGGIPWRYLGSTAAVIAILLFLIVLFAPYASKVFPRANTWRARVERFIGSDDVASKGDKDGDYQIRQALTAVAIGGVTGRGPGHSYMKNFLPMAFSDFIFAIILEEYGAWGGILVLAAFLLLMYRSIIVMRRCQKPFHAFVIMGITIIIEIQALINMLVGVGLMPVTGQTLPFVSQGGSSDIFMGFAFGIILSVSNVNPAPVVAKASDAPSADAESDEHQASTNADDGDYYEEAEAITFG